jgi:hypothetical protein
MAGMASLPLLFARWRRPYELGAGESSRLERVVSGIGSWMNAIFGALNGHEQPNADGGVARRHGQNRTPITPENGVGPGAHSKSSSKSPASYF